VRQQHGDARHGRRAGQATGPLGDDCLHGLLHARIERVVVDAPSQPAGPPVAADASDARRVFSGERGLEGGNRGVEGEGRHQPQGFPLIDGRDRGEQVFGHRVETGLADGGGIPAGRLPSGNGRPPVAATWAVPPKRL